MLNAMDGMAAMADLDEAVAPPCCSHLEELEKEFPSSFKAVFVCSREEGPGTLKGKLDAEVIAQFFRDWKPEQSRFLAIGSKAMKNHAYSVLEDSGFHLKLLSKF